MPPEKTSLRQTTCSQIPSVASFRHVRLKILGFSWLTGTTVTGHLAFYFQNRIFHTTRLIVTALATLVSVWAKFLRKHMLEYCFLKDIFTPRVFFSPSPSLGGKMFSLIAHFLSSKTKIFRSRILSAATIFDVQVDVFYCSDEFVLLWLVKFNFAPIWSLLFGYLNLYLEDF